MTCAATRAGSASPTPPSQAPRRWTRSRSSDAGRPPSSRLLRGRPAGEQAEGLGGPRAWLGGIGDDHQAGVGADLQPVEAELQLAHDRVVEPLDALGVQPDVVGGPEPAELLAPVASSPTRSAARGRAGCGRPRSAGSPRSPWPRGPSRRRSPRASGSRNMKRAQLPVAGACRRRRGTARGPSWLAPSASRRPFSAKAAAAVIESSIHCTLADGPCAWPRRRRPRGGRPAGVREVEQMRAFRLVEPQRVGQRVQDAVGGAAEIAALHPVVVVDAEPGERRDLLTAQSRAPDAVRRRSRPASCGRDPRAPGGEEVADLAPGSIVREG